MVIKNNTIKKLIKHYKEISLLGKINGLLNWDLNVNLPEKAGKFRAEQISYLTKTISDKWLDKEFRKNLEQVDKEKNLSLEEKAVVRNLKHSSKYYFRVPQKVIVDFSRVTAEAFIAWRQAKEDNKFILFEPHLKKIVSFNQKIAGYIGYKDNPYDALLDLYEPGLTFGEGKSIFSILTREIVPLVKKIKKSRFSKVDQSLFEKDYPVEFQKKIAEFVLQKIGYDFDAGRQDVSAHPFTTELGEGDVRLTNRYSSNSFIESLMVAMHEGGHGLYEQGVNLEYSMTPLEGGVSLGIHESQSRFWENQIGRSWEFIRYIEPVLSVFYPKQLAKEDANSLYRLFNMVSPSLIRVEADEVTYNLHIAIRFEIEEALLNDRISVASLPQVWGEKMKKYLGVVPNKDSEGVLQDVHWSHGLMGYFPTYTLGNLYAAQFANKIGKDLDMKKLILEGNFGEILAWYRQKIHKYGSLYWPDELVKKVTGEKLNPKFFLNYLVDKYSAIYGFSC